MKIIDLNEQVYFKDVDAAPGQFKAAVQRIAQLSNEIGILSPQDQVTTRDFVLEFGRGKPLPTEPNTVIIGNKYFSKDAQMNKLSSVVPTIKTFRSSLEVASREYIAKKRNGQRQDGQLINQAPENEDEYVFQPLVNIVSEFRVIVYYMNGKYHTSGIYQKSGSNASFRSIDVNGSAGKKIAGIAMKASESLGYGFSGVDVALVGAENKDDLVMTENVLGYIASRGTRILGSMTDMESVLSENFLVVLECNTMPSMSNPAIFYDLMSSMKSKART